MKVVGPQCPAERDDGTVCWMNEGHLGDHAWAVPMPKWTLPPHAAELLGLTASNEAWESIMWMARTDGTIHFGAPCSDVFWWATADWEEIGEEDMPLFRQCMADLDATDEHYMVEILYAARKRGMRPMSLWLGIRGDRAWQHSRELFDMFLAAGPERDPKEEG